MAYKNKYGITKIKRKRYDNLQINWDYQRTPASKFPVFLYTPDMENTDEHYHIKLDLKQARKLRDWLDTFIQEKEEKRKR